MTRILVLGFLLTVCTFGIAMSQQQENKIIVQPDIHFRAFGMSTAYSEGDYKDDYALGLSLNMGAKVSLFGNWSFHVGYRGFTNAASSELWREDPVSGQGNRYELGLFDILNPKDRFFGKLETFSLAYSQEKFGVKAGRMGINSDWVNAQDGRLSPTAVEGVHAWYAPNTLWKFSGYGIGRMSIRGSSQWMEVGGTVGIFPQGRTEEGRPAAYYGNTESSWLGIFEIDRKIGAKSKFHFSNTFAQNLFSTYWLGIESNFPGEKQTVNLGLQGGFQHGIGNGGNEDFSLRYKNPKDKNFALSGRIGWRNSRWITHLNLTQVFGSGRWLSPREWGKDAWYTFIPRERNEGFEAVTALVGFGEYRFEEVPVQIYTHLGIHWLPDTQDAAANKYNFPSYRQVNLGLKYQPKNLKNLDFHVILVTKNPLKSMELSPNQIYNKVEMLHFNGILNWRWN